MAHERLSHDLDASRAAQLRRDLALTAEQRLREAERELTAHGEVATVRVEQPLRFASYDDFVAWRRTRASRE